MDELGYLRFDSHLADLLYEIISRHEVRGEVLTVVEKRGNLVVRDGSSLRRSRGRLGLKQALTATART